MEGKFEVSKCLNSRHDRSIGKWREYLLGGLKFNDSL